MKKNLNINEKKLKKIVSESIKKVVTEGFCDDESIEDIIMDLYNFGAELQLNKDAVHWSVKGVGSVIMESCKKIMELYKEKPCKDMFDGEFNKKIKDLGL